MEKTKRLYRDLAWIWPIIRPAQDYVTEIEQLVHILREHSRIEIKTLLHLGCGGGHHDFALKKYFKVTGIDISEAMLELARKLNPEVTYYLGDMRSTRLGTRFDVVVIFDSINYILTRQELSATCKTAFEHLNPGGVIVIIAEVTKECFQQNRTICSVHSQGDIEVVFIQNYYDPDPLDTTYEANFVFLIRQRGKFTIETN
jgi:SAM-dependent methyltransferase